MAVFGMDRVGSGAYDYFTGRFGPVVRGIGQSPETEGLDIETLIREGA